LSTRNQVVTTQARANGPRGLSGRAVQWMQASSTTLPVVYAALVIIAIWQTVVIVMQPHVSLLPSPWLTAQTFVSLTASGELPHHVMVSLTRVGTAWLLAAALAVPLGLLMGRSRRIERIVDPFVELFRPISPLAWIPLAILWFGIGETGKIFIIFIGAFFPTLLNTIAGVKSVDPVLIRAGQVLGCTTEQALFRKVILKAAMPQIIVGLRVSFGAGWMAIIAAELVAANSGLGYLIADGMEIMRSDHVLVGMVVIGVLGFLFDLGFRKLDQRFSWA
jgi:ABC-type nitrate/sulfonate/bicarbonate transport system permease component